MDKKKLFLTSAAFAVLLAAGFIGCKPKTITQKIEDKVEDAGHEVHQGMERTEENVHNATDKK